MLCVIQSRKDDRKRLLNKIINSQHIWMDSTMTDPQKIALLLNNDPDYISLNANPVTEFDFSKSTSSYKIMKIYLMWVDLSLLGIVNKNLHGEWINHLQAEYKDKVGDIEDMMDGVTLHTCLLWIPSLLVFYIHSACSPAKIMINTDDTTKRRVCNIWEGISASDRQSLPKLQYHLITLPDTWLEYSISENQFASNSLIVSTKYLLEMDCFKNWPIPEQHSAQHYSMFDPNTPFCLSTYTCRKCFRSVLFHCSTFRCHCKQYLPTDIHVLNKKQIELDGVYLLDLDDKDHEIGFYVDVMQNNGMFTNLHSTIRISRTHDIDFL